MFELFTDAARGCLVVAQEVARRAGPVGLRTRLSAAGIDVDGLWNALERRRVEPATEQKRGGPLSTYGCTDQLLDDILDAVEEPIP